MTTIRHGIDVLGIAEPAMATDLTGRERFGIVPTHPHGLTALDFGSSVEPSERGNLFALSSLSCELVRCEGREG